MDNSSTFRTHNSKIWLCSLLSYFMNIKSIDDNIELLRVSLCSQPNFSPYKLFHFLDKSSKEFLLLNDFIKFLKEMRIPFEEKYLRIFIHNFDKDGDFSLNLNEFLGLILPKKNQNLAKNISINLKQDNTEDIICSNVKNIFGKLICEELELIKNCIKTAKSCKEIIGFTLYEAFLLIAGNSKYICEKSLCNFLQKNNVMLNSNDMHQLMFRLDTDNDGKISFEEFKEIFFPIKEEEIMYQIKENNKNDIITNDYSFLKNTKEKKEQIKEKIEFNKINNPADFTFSRNLNTNSKISIKTNLDYNKGLKKLMNYKYDDDLIKNKENKPANTDINNNNRIESLYDRTKYIMDNKRPNLFNTKISPKIKITNQSPTPNPEPTKCIPNPKTYQFEYSSNPLIIKKNNNSNISSPMSPKIVRNQRSNRYQSPKTKHTKSPLHYDYSTYSDEDGDEYFKQKKLKESKNTFTDHRERNINDKKLCKIFGGIDYKNEIKNNLEKMFLEDEQGNKKKVVDIADTNKEIKIRKFNFISNENQENDIKMVNFDDIRKKKFKNENYI